jgi:hypothetical protein
MDRKSKFHRWAVPSSGGSEDPAITSDNAYSRKQWDVCLPHKRTLDERVGTSTLSQKQTIAAEALDALALCRWPHKKCGAVKF